MKLPETVTTTIYLHSHQDPDGGYFVTANSLDMTDQGWSMIGKKEIIIDVPQDVDPVQAEIEGIEKLIEKTNLEHYAKIKLMTDRMDSLLAIEHKGE